MISLAGNAQVAANAVESVITWVRLALDAAGTVIIVIGGARALAALPSAIRGTRRFTEVRLGFARYLALTLEFQLASDVLQTAVTPTWETLGQLAVIAAIRTMLNVFLGREMREERATVGEPSSGDGASSIADLARSSR